MTAPSPTTAFIIAIVAAGLLVTAWVLTRVLIRKARASSVRRKADRHHAALVAEARSEWTLKQEYKVECEWRDAGQPSRRAGWTILFAEENSLGERRVRVVHKPDGWPVKGMHLYAQLKSWEAQAEVRSLPRPDRVPA